MPVVTSPSSQAAARSAAGLSNSVLPVSHMAGAPPAGEVRGSGRGGGPPPAGTEGIQRLQDHAAEAFVLAALPDVTPTHLALPLQIPAIATSCSGVCGGCSIRSVRQ